MSLRTIILSTFAAASMAVASAGFAQAQGIAPETVTKLAEEVAALRTQIAASNEFASKGADILTKQKALIDNAPADTEKMIADLESLIDKFKVGSPTANLVQQSMQDMKLQIDKFRAGSEVQKKAADKIRDALASVEASDKDRDRLVGEAMAAVTKLRASKDDLIALQIAGAYTEMADVYRGMLNDFSATVDGANNVVDGISRATGMQPTE